GRPEHAHGREAEIARDDVSHRRDAGQLHQEPCGAWRRRVRGGERATPAHRGVDRSRAGPGPGGPGRRIAQKNTDTSAYTSESFVWPACRSGETGRRAGLKIPWGSPPVWVRFPPPAPFSY